MGAKQSLAPVKTFTTVSRCLGVQTHGLHLNDNFCQLLCNNKIQGNQIQLGSWFDWHTTASNVARCASSELHITNSSFSTQVFLMFDGNFRVVQMDQNTYVLLRCTYDWFPDTITTPQSHHAGIQCKSWTQLVSYWFLMSHYLIHRTDKCQQRYYVGAKQSLAPVFHIPYGVNTWFPHAG